MIKWWNNNDELEIVLNENILNKSSESDNESKVEVTINVSNKDIFIDTENDDDSISIKYNLIKLNNNKYIIIDNNLLSSENSFLIAKKYIEEEQNKDKNKTSKIKDYDNKSKFDNKPSRKILYDNSKLLNKEYIITLEENLKGDKTKKNYNFWYNKFEY